MTSDTDWTVTALRTAIRDGDVTATEICECYLDRIKSADGELKAMTAVLGDSARTQAAEIDQHRDIWRDRPLVGVPITIKDVICTK